MWKIRTLLAWFKANSVAISLILIYRRSPQCLPAANRTVSSLEFSPNVEAWISYPK